MRMIRAAAAFPGLFVVSLTLATDGAARTHQEGRATVPSIVARALPAVVSITTRQIERDQFNQPIPTRGLGSGVIVDSRGYVLTNLHVVAGAREIRVTLTDGRSFRGVPIGSDRFSELAVVKIDGPRLPSRRFRLRSSSIGMRTLPPALSARATGRAERLTH